MSFMLGVFFTICVSNTLSSSNALTQQNKIDLLMNFNNLRSNTAQNSEPSAADMNFVWWDDSLSMISQDAANQCNNAHPSYTHFLEYQSKYSQWTYPSVGKLASYRSITSINMNINISSQLISLLNTLYNTHNNNYNYSQFSLNRTNYMIWSKLRYIGCGYQRCHGQNIIFYCSLFYTDLIFNNYPWNNGKPCSKCDIDKNQCWNGLCYGCMSSDYYTNNSPNKIGDICSNLGMNYSSIKSTEMVFQDVDTNDKALFTIKNEYHRTVLEISVALVILCIFGVCVANAICTNTNCANQKQETEINVSFDYSHLA
eukprot:355988_1